MKYFLLLGQEREVKIPAPVWEVAARAAAPPPLPPLLSGVLHGKFDCKMSCFTPKVLSGMNHFLTCPPIVRSLAQQTSATLLATADENLSFPTPPRSACIQKGKNKVIFPKEQNLASMKSLLNWSAVYVT
ncbi:hypothetical protein RYX36_009706 [Vicia faba]